MGVGGVAVRIIAEALFTGNVRLKRITAEQFLGPDILRDSSGENGDDPRALLIHPCPAAGSTSPVHAQLRIVPTTARQRQSPDPPQQPPLPLHCELCGLGAWLRGQGAVPGVHWVQLWRGAGGALRLRLCDGKPTALPEKEAEAVQQQMETGETAANVAVRSSVRPAGGAVAPSAPTSRTLGVPEPAAARAASAKAAAAHAAAQLVGPAAQAVADAAAPWKLHAPTCTAPCVPARAILQACPLGAWGAGPDGEGSAVKAAVNGGYRVPLPSAQWGVGSGRSSGPVTSAGAGRDSNGADSHGSLDTALPHPRRSGNAGSGGHSLSLSLPPVPPPPMLPAVPTLPPPPPLLSPPPPPPALPAQQAPHPAEQAGGLAAMGVPGPPRIQAAAGFGSAEAATATIRKVVSTVRIAAVCGRNIGWLTTEAVALWPDACQLQFGQAAAVTLHLVQEQRNTPTRHTAAWEGVSAKLARYNATWFALVGLGQADDVFDLWRDHAGAVWASRQRARSLQQQGQQVGQRLGQQLVQQKHQDQSKGGAAVPRRPLSMDILTGCVGRNKIRLRTAEVDGVLAPSLS